jgi:hypothetical protein
LILVNKDILLQKINYNTWSFELKWTLPTEKNNLNNFIKVDQKGKNFGIISYDRYMMLIDIDLELEIIYLKDILNLESELETNKFLFYDKASLLYYSNSILKICRIIYTTSSQNFQVLNYSITDFTSNSVIGVT